MDLRFLKGSQAGLMHTIEGNLKIIELTQRRNRMKRDIAAEQARIIAKNNGIPPLDIEQQMADYMNDYEFLSEGEREEINKLVSEGKKASKQGVPTVVNIRRK
jgi:hypothetical protein